MFTWTDEKNQLNKKKHGFFLSEVVDVFNDPHLVEFYDQAHSSLDEDRFINLGCLNNNTIILIVTVDKTNGDTQIITAREATTKEQEAYHEHYRKSANGSGS